MEIFAPLESDLDESGGAESQRIRKDCKSPNGSIPGNQPKIEKRQEDEDETILCSDAESESLLLPVEICVGSESLSAAAPEDSMDSSPAPKVTLVREDVAKTVHKDSSPDHRPGRHTEGPSVPQQSSTARARSPEPSQSRSGPAHGINSTSFWKSCNVAGCTEAIFTDFINGMNDISNRIQSDQASQEDYDRALSVMAASGRLAEFVSKQQEELKRKLKELHKAAAAMMEVVSALNK
ncbi:uncharacterized protein phf11 [Mugil cephalus]|uniref:uncharacterized protein phf11 n=1 Tax=Mugil cephalus TaxID=48193 RepID=UPI001FB85246|nr:uncharacterized protein phf11 [Mugil cephalus]